MKRVLVFGCFDLFHAGHVNLLSQASDLGEVTVAVGDDARVRALKGEGRPIIPQWDRFTIVKACRYVENAFIFSPDEDIVKSHIQVATQAPVDIVACGENTNFDEAILEGFESAGIEVRRLKSLPLHTSDIIERIKRT